MISANIPNDVRKAIYRRDGYACALCGDPRHLHIHHAIPRSSGGGNSPRNLITLCRYCHSMAHGTNLVTDVWLSADEVRQYAEEVQQNAVEYLADLYATAFPESVGLFSEFEVYDYDGNPDMRDIAKSECRVCSHVHGRGW